ncbi:MAG: hypothetical protein AB8G15_14715 [Saprospiraceae bacterium]
MNKILFKQRSYRLLCLLLSLSLSTLGTAQIRLENPSFEGEPQDATMPAGWHACAQGTTPDILPGAWGVRQEASDGDTYMGLITRDDGSWESVGQRLSEPLEAKECYNISMDLARSDTYLGYSMPLKLKIWGCKTKCSKDQLLGETDFIKHTDWKRYPFAFVPNEAYNYIIFEAQYISGISFAYKGNILVDNCSTIDRCTRASLE